MHYPIIVFHKPFICRNYWSIMHATKGLSFIAAENGGAENAGQDIAGQDNDGQEKHHAWVEIKT